MNPEVSSVPKTRILLIDDDEVFGRLMQRYCTELGVTLLYCSSVKQLEGYALNTVDLLICDFELQNINGLQLVRALGRRGSVLPVLLVSAYRDLGKVLTPTSPPFIAKAKGPEAILKEAMRLTWESRPEEEL